jgi:ribosomal protein S18 acetylase RimI-like enzyme
LGFLAAGIRKNYYEHPVEDALILWLGLPEGSALDFREGE